MRLALRLNARNSWNNLLELKFVLQPKQIKQGGRDTVATSEHLVGNCILKKGSSAALRRSCSISHRDDAPPHDLLSAGGCCRDGEGVVRPSQLLRTVGGERGREEGEHLGPVRSGSTHAAWLDVLARAPTDLLPCSFSCHSHGKQMWNVTLFRLKVPHLTQGHD